jgi:hypothetical protein
VRRGCACLSSGAADEHDRLVGQRGLGPVPRRVQGPVPGRVRARPRDRPRRDARPPPHAVGPLAPKTHPRARRPDPRRRRRHHRRAGGRAAAARAVAGLAGVRPRPRLGRPVRGGRHHPVRGARRRLQRARGRRRGSSPPSARWTRPKVERRRWAAACRATVSRSRWRASIARRSGMAPALKSPSRRSRLAGPRRSRRGTTRGTTTADTTATPAAPRMPAARSQATSEEPGVMASPGARFMPCRVQGLTCASSSGTSGRLMSTFAKLLATLDSDSDHAHHSPADGVADMDWHSEHAD